MKVLLIAHSSGLAGGGAERSLLGIASYLNKQPSVAVLVVLPAVGSLNDELAKRDIGTAVLSYTRGVASHRKQSLHRNISGLETFRRFVTEHSPDVILTNTAVIPWFAYVAHRLGIPHGWFLREDPFSDAAPDLYPKPEEALAAIRDFSDRIFVNSHFMKQKYMSLLRREDIEVVYPSFDTSILDHAENSSHVPRNNKTFRLLVAGRISPVKNQLEVLEAINLLRQTQDNFVLTVVGWLQRGFEEYYDAFVNFIRTNGLEHFVQVVDYQEDFHKLLSQHDISIVPSVEGFGRVTVEAMLLKKAVVAANVGGNHEILGDAPGAGLLYPPGRPDVLAEHLKLLIEEPSRIERMGQKAHTYACRRFLGEDHLAKLYASLETLSTSPKQPHDDWIIRLAEETNLSLMRRARRLQAQLDATYTSMSWRLTAPLRRISRSLFERRKEPSGPGP
jgi:glycosyltransferase involved in cell wall biosynthesis